MVSAAVLVAALASDTLPATSATPPLKIEKVPAPALPTVMALADQSEPLPLTIRFPSLPALPAIVVMPEVVMLPPLVTAKLPRPPTPTLSAPDTVHVESAPVTTAAPTPVTAFPTETAPVELTDPAA